MEASYFFGYSLGTVLAGFFFLLPAWVVSNVWNTFLPQRAVNPWTLPLVTILVCFVLALIGTGSDPAEEASRYRPIISLGLTPAVMLCIFRRQAYGRNRSSSSMEL